MVLILKTIMSADIPTAFPAYDGETLDALLIDPALRKIFNEIHELNSTNGGMSHKEAQSKMNEFDLIWKDKDLLGEVAVVTGYAHYYFANTDDQPGELIRRRIEDARVVSNGFTTLTAMEDDDGMTLSEPKTRLALCLREQMFAPDGTLEWECPIAMSIDELESIQFEANMSIEQAEAILKYYVPDFLSEMDSAQMESCDEIETVMKIRGTAWEVGSLGEDVAIIAKAAAAYFEASLQFDALPYVISPLKSGVYVYDQSGGYSAQRAEIFTPAIITVNRIVFLSPIKEEGDTVTDTLTPHMDCWLHADDQHSDSQRMLIPLEVIHTFLSLRESFYGAQDNE